MKGTISEINFKANQVAVSTENGDFSIFELLSQSEVEVGDEVEWLENNPLGHGLIKNLNSNEEIEVFFQNHWVSKDNLHKQLQY